MACFTAGTPIVVDLDGESRTIEELEVGDLVLARSEFDPTGPLELKRIEEKFVRTAALMELIVRGRSIKTTAEHPFYVPAQGRFVPAGELKAGDELVSHSGELVRIDSVSPLGEIATVYNLRVADHHTYFVGGGLWQFDVWVHNAYSAPNKGVTIRVRNHFVATKLTDAHVDKAIAKSIRRHSGATGSASHEIVASSEQVESMLNMMTTWRRNVHAANPNLTALPAEVKGTLLHSSVAKTDARS